MKQKKTHRKSTNKKGDSGEKEENVQLKDSRKTSPECKQIQQYREDDACSDIDEFELDND